MKYESLCNLPLTGRSPNSPPSQHMLHTTAQDRTQSAKTDRGWKRKKRCQFDRDAFWLITDYLETNANTQQACIFHTYISSKTRYAVIKYLLLITIKIIRALLHTMQVCNKQIYRTKSFPWDCEWQRSVKAQSHTNPWYAPQVCCDHNFHRYI